MSNNISLSEKLKNLKLEVNILFPKVKISAKKNHYNSTSITILESPFDIFTNAGDYDNHYTISAYDLRRNNENNTYTDKGFKLLKTIHDTIHQDVTYYETCDYGTQPSLYVDIRVGNWDRKFKLINNSNNEN